MQSRSVPYHNRAPHTALNHDLSTKLPTQKKYYKNEKNLVLLKVETLNLDHLLWEQASDGNMFPHLYSPLNVKYIVDELDILIDEHGNHVLPDNF